jgi:hypothetical protein
MTPKTVQRLMRRASTPCAPVGNSKRGGDGEVNDSAENWTCLQKSDVEQLKVWISKLDERTRMCEKKNDECKLKKLKEQGVPVGFIENKRLRPKAPAAWENKPATWLMTSDFEKVFKQYEAAFPEFSFLGATPIDFDKPFGNSCVWPKICKFNLKQAAKEGKTKIGLIFNEDSHDEPGSHWVCAFIDIPKRTFYYIDSVANPIPPEVKDFAVRLSDESKQMYGEPMKLIVSTMPHQRGNNQCGMYCLFFIISLLTETATFKELMEDRVPDSSMADLRNVLFRKRSGDSGQNKKTTKAQEGGKNKSKKTQKRRKNGKRVRKTRRAK